MFSFKKLQQRIDRGEVIILDGATGTELDRRGAPMSTGAWTAAALENHSHVVRQVHEDYIRAGADIIIANTFSASRPILERAGLSDQTHELNTRAVTLVKEALDVAADRPVCIAGSMFNIPNSIRADRAMTTEQCKAAYQEQADILAEAGVDLLMLEMMSDVAQTEHAIEAAQSTGLPTWVGFSVQMSADGSHVTLRNNPDQSLAEALDIVTPKGGSLVSIMHTEVEDTGPGLEVAVERWGGVLGAYAHSGEFARPTWNFEGIISPEEYLTETRKWMAMGVQVIGGCCGIGPDHIRLLKEQLLPTSPIA